MTLRVGFIGLGTMGQGMARNLAKAGFPLTVMTHTAGKAEKFASEVPGARAAATPAEVGKASDVIVSSVPDSPEVEQVLLGENGTASGAAEGAIVIDTSTIAAQAARSIARRLAEKSIMLLDAPVSG